MAAKNLLLLHKPVLSIKTFNGFPLQRKCMVSYRKILMILHVCSEEKKIVFIICDDFIAQHLLCSFYMWQEGRERMKRSWKRPLFSFPLKAALFSSTLPFLSWAPSTSKSWPGPVCCVTCLPKGSFQINSASPWDAFPPHWEPFRDTIWLQEIHHNKDPFF